MATLSNVYWLKYLFLIVGIIALVESLANREWLNAIEIVPITGLLWLLGRGIERLWEYACRHFAGTRWSRFFDQYR